MSSVVVGVDKNGNVAAEAKDVAALIKIDSKGKTNKISFKPKTKNPGQEVMQAAGEAEAIVMGLMQGPPNSKRKIVRVKPGTSIEKVVETYKQGKLYTTKNGYRKKTGYNIPKKDGSGKGTRANTGRNPECAPEDYKEIGQGSGTRSGRAAEASPQRKAYNITQNTIDNLVEKYSNAKTNEQKEIAAQAVGQYLKEATDKNLKGKEAEKYVANKLKENGYSKNNNSSSSKKSGKPKGKTAAKKAA